MKYIHLILLSLILTILPTNGFCQDMLFGPDRAPEMEALKQTEKMQKELTLTVEQFKQVYAINLKYARERKVSNTRAEAAERAKNKDLELQKVLTAQQYNLLQTKRAENSTFDIPNDVKPTEKQGTPQQSPGGGKTPATPSDSGSNRPSHHFSYAVQRYATH